MKTLRFLSCQKNIIAISMTILVVLSCKEEETPNPLLGTWVGARVTQSDCDDPIDNWSQNVPCDNTDCVKITFLSHGVLSYEQTLSGTKEVFDGTYTISGKNVTICADGSCKTHRYTITANTLSLSNNDNSSGCTRISRFERE